MNKTLVAVTIFGAALAGCGGGGSTSSQTGDTPVQPSTTTPSGLYLGTSNDGRTITGLILADSSYYFLYSSPNNPALIGGAIQGTGSTLNGSFTSSDGIDLNLEGNNVMKTTISATYMTGASLNGTVNYPTLNYASTFTSTYSKDYEATPSLAMIAGTYTGLAASPATSEQTSLTVSATGAITGSDVTGCSFSGNISTMTKGNAYNASITFGGPPCLISGGTFSGIAYFASSSKRLYAVALNAGRATGFVFNGVKP